MTENEAIKELKEGIEYCTSGEEEYFKEALGMGIVAIEEIQQYRAIGTVEEFKELKEKAEPKKPSYEGDGYAPDGTFVWDEWLCPHCEARYEVDYDEYDYCPDCGQKLDLRK